MKVLSLLLRNETDDAARKPIIGASMKVLSLLLRNVDRMDDAELIAIASMKVLSLLLRNLICDLLIVDDAQKPQ